MYSISYHSSLPLLAKLRLKLTSSALTHPKLMISFEFKRTEQVLR